MERRKADNALSAPTEGWEDVWGKETKKALILSLGLL